jgi:predicted nucleic acid-binding protein
MSVFWDASALAHVCVPGQITRTARDLMRADVIAVWWGTTLEVRSVLNRVHRQGAISSAANRASWERASGLLLGCLMIPPTDAVEELASAQLDRFPLKASDALQLAAALVWCKQIPRGRRFICNDRQLLTAATAAGFEVHSV